MCGITAIWSEEIYDWVPAFKEMLGAIKHRGYKDFEVQTLGKCLMGVNRLDIVDPEHGQQPFANEDITICCVHNGEIYNYKELKSELQQQGHRFQSDCDTEVLVHLYEEYREEMISKLDGMFAFVVYDSKTDALFAVRDPYGIKPLYYAEAEGAKFITSEMKALESELIEEIFYLPPGHYYLNGEVKRYYSLPPSSLDYDINSTKLKVRELLTDAVRKRVQTDLPVGVFLSGGVDSAIVLSIAMKYHNDVTALTVGMTDSSDLLAAKEFCEVRGIKHVVWELKREDVTGLFPGIVYQLESFEPNIIRAGIFTYFVAKLARDNGFKVALSGEGSDEIFAGYKDFCYYPEERINKEVQSFLGDLHRTQLKRLDMASMANTVEVRVPFLDTKLVEYVVHIPPQLKVTKNEDGCMTKYILREAFREELPAQFVEREKVPMDEGVFVSTGNSASLFEELADESFSNGKFSELAEKYPEFNLRDKEEAYYFSIFKEHFLAANFSKERIKVRSFEFQKV